MYSFLALTLHLVSLLREVVVYVKFGKIIFRANGLVTTCWLVLLIVVELLDTVGWTAGTGMSVFLVIAC